MNKALEEKCSTIYFAMTNYMAGDARRIQHFAKVHDYGRLIGLSEGLDEHTQFILEIAALMHDIGIRNGERLYGRNDGRIQQELGPGEAKKFCSLISLMSGTSKESVTLSDIIIPIQI